MHTKKAEESSLSHALWLSFHVIFRVICFLAQMQMFWKITYPQIFKENICDGVSFSKIKNLPCSDSTLL